MNPPQKVITDSDKSPLIQVLALMFMVIAVLACFVRTGTKIYMIKALRIDDVLTVVATVLAIGQSVAVFVAADNGLGRHSDELSADEVDTFFKSQYAINTMFIASLFCCKLSGTISLRMMSQKNERWVIIACEIIVCLWGLSALVVNFFQCQLPSPWLYIDGQKCINRTAFWTYFSIANMVTDLAIVSIMGHSVLKIHTSWSKKILVMAVFGSRILITPAAAVQLYFTNRAFASADFSFDIWKAAIAMQLVQCLAILTVCLPNFKPFLDSVQSGQIRIDDLRRQGKSSSNGYPTDRAYRSKRSTQRSAVGEKSQQRTDVYEMADLDKAQPEEAVKPKQQQQQQQGPAWDGQSHTSQTILIQNSWQVDVQSTHGRRSL